MVKIEKLPFRKTSEKAKQKHFLSILDEIIKYDSKHCSYIFFCYFPVFYTLDDVTKL